MRPPSFLHSQSQIAVFMFFVFVGVVNAATLPLYSNAVIHEWEPEFRAAVNDNYVRLFRPQLNTQEAKQLRSLRFEFPSDPKLVLFEFKTHSDGRVVMPVASLLFLKELVAAQVWLEANGYSTQPILDYLSIVRSGRLDNWPTSDRLPLKALGIPADAMNDEHLLEKRNEILSKTLLFILGHELGHLIQNLSAQADCETQIKRKLDCNFAELQKSEANADAFAVDMFRRIGLVPSASNFFFAASSRLSPMPFEYNDEQAWQKHAASQSHPLDSARIRNVAALIKDHKNAFASGFSSSAMGALRVEDAVTNLTRLADGLDDRSLAGMQIAWAKSLKPEDIKPRRSHEPRLRPTPGVLAAKQPWTGYFIGKVQYANGGSAPLEVVMRTIAGNPQFTGDVMLGGIRGRIEGRYENATRASAIWNVAGDIYRLTMVSSPTSDHLDATYEHTTAKLAKGRWTLGRASSLR